MEVNEIKRIQVFDDEHNRIDEGDLVIYKNNDVNIIAEFAGIEKGLIKFQNLIGVEEFHKVRQSSIEEIYLFNNTDYGEYKYSSEETGTGEVTIEDN